LLSGEKHRLLIQNWSNKSYLKGEKTFRFLHLAGLVHKGKTPLDAAEMEIEIDLPEIKVAKKETATLLRKHGGNTKLELEGAASARGLSEGWSRPGSEGSGGERTMTIGRNWRIGALTVRGG